MKMKELTQKNAKELELFANEKRVELAKLAVEYRTQKVNNVKSMAAVKKQIARALTLLRQHQLAGEEK